MIVNFRSYEINQGTYKLIRTLTLIKKTKKNNVERFACIINHSTLIQIMYSIFNNQNHRIENWYPRVALKINRQNRLVWNFQFYKFWFCRVFKTEIKLNQPLATLFMIVLTSLAWKNSWFLPCLISEPLPNKEKLVCYYINSYFLKYFL